MKYLIASDLHGAKSSAEKILELNHKYNFETIYLLGDINYNGARNVPPIDYSPIDVTALLNKIKEKIVFIRGNCDSRVDEFVFNKKFQDLLKIKKGKYRFIFTHGDLFNKDSYKIRKNTVFLYGHTHIFEMSNRDHNSYIINPGSISIPKNNNPRTYMIFDDESFSFSLFHFNDNLIDTLTIKKLI